MNPTSDPRHEPGENEPAAEHTCGDEVDFIERTVAEITDAEVDEHLHRVLSQIAIDLHAPSEWAAQDGDSHAEAALRNKQQSAPALTARQEPPEFRILGALQMTVDGQSQETGLEQEQRLLVALLSERGTPVTSARLMEAIWDDIPGPGATIEAIYHLVGWLRKRLATMGADDALTAARGTLRLDIPAARVDVHRFHDLIARASELAGDDRRVIALLEEALRLHQGEPLAGLGGRWIGGYRHRLVEERRTAELTLCEAAIRVGESHERIDELHSLFRDRPEDEWAAWLYMHALYRAGRGKDALLVGRTVTRHLGDPTATASPRALLHLCERILCQDDGLLRPEAVKFPGGEAGMRTEAVFHMDGSAAAAVFGTQVNYQKPQ